MVMAMVLGRCLCCDGDVGGSYVGGLWLSVVIVMVTRGHRLCGGGLWLKVQDHIVDMFHMVDMVDVHILAHIVQEDMLAVLVHIVGIYIMEVLVHMDKDIVCMDVVYVIEKIVQVELQVHMLDIVEVHVHTLDVLVHALEVQGHIEEDVVDVHILEVLVHIVEEDMLLVLVLYSGGAGSYGQGYRGYSGHASPYSGGAYGDGTKERTLGVQRPCEGERGGTGKGKGTRKWIKKCCLKSHDTKHGNCNLAYLIVIKFTVYAIIGCQILASARI